MSPATDPRWRAAAATTTPLFPTHIRRNHGHGWLEGVGPGKNGSGGSHWLYMSVPMRPLTDARDDRALRDGLAAMPLAFAKLALMAPQSSLRGRKAVKGAYREVHLLAVNVPRPFRAPPDHPLAGFYARHLRGLTVLDRRLLFGVRLSPGVKLRGGLWRQAKQLTRAALDVLGEDARPASAFEMDADLTRAALASCGLRTPTEEEIRLCDSWWSAGSGADVPVLPHVDHMHGFTRLADALAAERSSSEDRDGLDCDSWGGRFDHEWGWQMCALTGTELNDMDGVDAYSEAARWGAYLLRSGCHMVSVRGSVEPAGVTRKEIQANMARYLRDLRGVDEAGVEAKTEQVDSWVFHREVERLYARKAASPTLCDMSVVAAVPGVAPDACEKLCSGRPIRLAPMVNLQLSAVGESQLCSGVRTNAALLDEPSDAVAFAGLNDLSVAGDPPAGAALVGLTEHDRQPCWARSDAASATDKAPLWVVWGATRSGKTMEGQWLWFQFGHIPGKRGELTPSVFINPKRQSLRRFAEWSGARRHDLDDMLTADGALDPVTFFTNREEAVSAASSMLQALFAGSPDQVAAAQLPLLEAVRFGVANGARATGECLTMRREWLEAQAAAETNPQRRAAWEHDAAVVGQMSRVAASLPQARALIGSGAGTAGLRVAAGMTLIEAAGGITLPDATDPAAMNLTDRVNLFVIRMILLSAMHALAGRGGVVFLDEGWVFLLGGRALLEQLGRLSASLRVLIVLMDQRVKESAELGDFISRGLVLSLPGKSADGSSVVAESAFKAFGLDPGARGRAERAGLGVTMDGGPEDGDGAGFNWASLRALIEPGSRRVARGAVAYYVDLYGRCPTVECVIPPIVAALASTNEEDDARAGAVA